MLNHVPCSCVQQSNSVIAEQVHIRKPKNELCLYCVMTSTLQEMTLNYWIIIRGFQTCWGQKRIKCTSDCVLLSCAHPTAAHIIYLSNFLPIDMIQGAALTIDYQRHGRERRGHQYYLILLKGVFCEFSISHFIWVPLDGRAAPVPLFVPELSDHSVETVINEAMTHPLPLSHSFSAPLAPSLIQNMS